MIELNNVVLENQAFIYGLTKYFDNYQHKDDLFQAGAIGLINAYKKYNPELQVKFTTYAFPYVLGEMKKCIRQDKGIKVGRKINKLNLQIEKASILLTQKLMREPSFKEISEFLEIPEIYIEEALKFRNKIESIDEPICSDSKQLTLHETIASKAVDINTLLALKQELLQLNEPEKSIIENRYLNDLTQTETANLLGLTQVQVSRKEQKVLTYLRNSLM